MPVSCLMDNFNEPKSRVDFLKAISFGAIAVPIAAMSGAFSQLRASSHKTGQTEPAPGTPGPAPGPEVSPEPERWPGRERNLAESEPAPDGPGPAPEPSPEPERWPGLLKKLV